MVKNTKYVQLMTKNPFFGCSEAKLYLSNVKLVIFSLFLTHFFLFYFKNMRTAYHLLCLVSTAYQGYAYCVPSKKALSTAYQKGWWQPHKFTYATRSNIPIITNVATALASIGSNHTRQIQGFILLYETFS